MKQLIIITLFTFAAVYVTNGNTEFISTSELEQEVLEILEQKCNSCHRIQNPRKVFTAENMNSHAKNINRQVFRWKRMPKGNDIKLTESEKHKLNNWINSLKK